MRSMNYKSDIFPPGTLPISPLGRSAGDRGGTSPPEEVNFHGKPEPPPLTAIPVMERDGRLQTRGDPPGTVDEGVRTRSRRTLPGAPPARLANAFKSPERKRTVDYEHRSISPPGGGWRQLAHGSPSIWIGPAPPGGFRSRRRGPPGSTKDTFHSHSAGRWRGSRLVSHPETHGKDAVMNNTNQGR